MAKKSATKRGGGASGGGASGGGESNGNKHTEAKMQLSGTTSQIAESLRQMSGPSEEEREGGNSDKDRRYREFLDALATPGYEVQVRRVRPTEYPSGLNARIVVYREETPAELRDVKENVFTRAGGHRYKVMVKDDSDKVIAAHIIENPESENAIEPPTVEDDVTDGDDILGQMPGSALDEMLADAKQEEEWLSKKEMLEQRRERIKAMRQGRKPEKDPQSDEIEALKGQLRQEREGQREDRLLSAITALGEKLTEGRNQGPSPEMQQMQRKLEELSRNNEELRRQVEAKQRDNMFDLVKSVMADQNKGMQAVGDAIKQMSESQLLQEIKALRSANKGDGIDADLNRLTKLKEIIGAGERSKSDRVTDAAVEMLLEKALGGGSGGGEEDTLKFAIKEMIPAVKEFIEGEVERRKNAQGGKITEEQKQEIYKQGARDMVDRMRKEARRHQLPAAEQTKQMPPEQKPKAQVPAEGQPEKKPAAEKKPSSGWAPEDEASPAPEKKPDPSLPAGPASLSYSRKKSLNFVIDQMVGDVREGCPDDTLLVGYALDLLDDDFLAKLCEVGDTDGLYKLIKGDVPEEKIRWLEGRGKADKATKIWINRVINSIQYEFTQEIKRADEDDDGDDSGEEESESSEETESSGWEPSGE